MISRIAVTIAVIALMLGAVGVAYGITEHSAAASQAQQIRQLRSKQAALSVRLAGILPQLTGTTRDLITCADLQHLQMSGIDATGNEVTTGYDDGGGANAVTLPDHCINH